MLRNTGTQEEKARSQSWQGRLQDTDLEHGELTDRIIGAAIEVHSLLGPGFLEAIYDRALQIEFRLRQIPFVSQMRIPVLYRDITSRPLSADTVCFSTSRAPPSPSGGSGHDATVIDGPDPASGDVRFLGSWVP